MCAYIAPPISTAMEELRKQAGEQSPTAAKQATSVAAEDFPRCSRCKASCIPIVRVEKVFYTYVFCKMDCYAKHVADGLV